MVNSYSWGKNVTHDVSKNSAVRFQIILQIALVSHQTQYKLAPLTKLNLWLSPSASQHQD